MKALQLLAVLAVAVLATSARASITGWQCKDDGDGAISNCTVNCSPLPADAITLCVNETLNSSPGHLDGSFQADSASDPTVTFDKTVTNGTGSAWSGYTFNMYMDQQFSCTAGTTPTGWTANAVTDGFGTYTDSHGTSYPYMATVTFTNDTGSDIAAGDSTTFGSSVNFTGFSFYTFELEQIATQVTPSPEPASLALIALGGSLMLRRRPVR
jgi:hypothetical protein